MVADGTTTPGTYPFTVTGTGGGLTNSAGATLIVAAPQPTNFSLTISPTAQSITAGGANIGYNILSSATNFNSPVTLSVGALPAGVGATIGVNPITPPQSSTLTVSANSNTVPGTYPLTVTGTGGGLTNSATGSVTVTAPSGGLPAGWNDVDIGAVGLAGSASFSSGTFTVSGSGSDIWTAADQFNYAYQSVSGNQTVIARVVTEQLTASFAKAGVMIRESLATNSVEASVLLTPTNGVALQIRPTTGAASINVSGWVKGPQPPYWVKLVRSGSTFTGYSSADGVTWTQVATTNVTMATSATAGLAVTSHDNTKLNTATFDNVSISAPVSDSNIAPNGSAFGWTAMTASSANTGKTAQPGLNDNNLAADVDLLPAGDAIGAWEAAGVTWASPVTISSADFINGTITTGGDGFLTANCKLQFSTDGTTWTDSGWTISPAYPNSSAAGGQTYTFSGTAVTGIMGARVIGQVRTVDTSYHWIVKEVQFIGH